MKKIRNQNRVDNLKNDVRTPKKSYGRQVYFTMLLVLILQLLNYALGDWVFLRADGVVAREKISVDSAYISEVLEVYVTRGQSVEKGQPLLKVNSNEVSAELLRLRLQERGLKEQKDEQGASTANNNNQATAESTNTTTAAVEQLAAVAVEKPTTEMTDNPDPIDAELSLISPRVTELAGRYQDGMVIAHVAGEVGIEIRSPGEVLVPGETFLEVYYDKPYVYAYLPNEYRRSIPIGLEVLVKIRNEKFIGHVAEIIPFSGVIPREFQNSVKAPGRHQIARIEFNEIIPVPLNQQVKVYRKDTVIGYYFNALWDLFS